MDLQKIVYLSDAQYADLIANGSITVGSTTIVYSANDLYITPSSGGTVPTGGTTGQALIKASNNDLDTVWGDIIKSSDLYQGGLSSLSSITNQTITDISEFSQICICVKSNGKWFTTSLLTSLIQGEITLYNSAIMSCIGIDQDSNKFTVSVKFNSHTNIDIINEGTHGVYVVVYGVN